MVDGPTASTGKTILNALESSPKSPYAVESLSLARHTSCDASYSTCTADRVGMCALVDAPLLLVPVAVEGLRVALAPAAGLVSAS